MADFTLNAPGTTNNPWTPANVIVTSSTIKSDATGFRANAAGVTSSFAHNVSYGSVITATVSIASGGASNGDDILVGAIVRGGGNEGCFIGMRVGAFTTNLVTSVANGTTTSISADVSLTRANSDIWLCSVSISGGTATITGKQNSGSNISFSANTTTTFASETTLAAGALYNPGNNNSLYLSQFTGTGVILNPIGPMELGGMIVQIAM